MRYQKIFSQIWFDEKFAALTPMQQRLYLYILTCPHGNLIGCFVLKTGYACADLKSLPKDFEKDLAKLIEMGLVKYCQTHELILIPNFLKYNPITNPNQKKAAAKLLKQLPKSQLLLHFKGLIEGLPEALWEGLREGVSKPETETETETETENNTLGPPDQTPNPEPSNPTQPPSRGVAKEVLTPVRVVSLWNQINPLKQKFPIKLTQSRAEKLRARLKENADPSYWRRVFENIRDIPFYRGEGPRGWKATLDWVIKNDTNGVKIYEQEPDRHYHGAAYYEQFAEVFET